MAAIVHTSISVLVVLLLSGHNSAITERVYYEWRYDDKRFHNITRVVDPSSNWGRDWTLEKEAFKKFHGQVQQDRICLEIFNDKANGFYVDLATHDHKAGSNTYIMDYYNDWSGVCIEPNPIDWDALLSNRHCNLYVNPVGDKTGAEMKFNFYSDKKMPRAYGGLVSPEFDNKVNEGTDVWTVTLDDILEHAKAPASIEYLSLDVEGAEFFVLKNFPFGKRKFLMITIERPNAHLHAILVKNMYIFVTELTGGDFGDCLYIHNSLENLSQKMDRYHKKGSTPKWFGKERAYLAYPVWSGSAAIYHADAQKITHYNHMTPLFETNNTKIQ